MHIYNWYQSIATVILLCTRAQTTIYMAHSPLLLSPLAGSLLLSFPTPFYLLGTLLAVTGSVHLGLRLLVNWPPLSQPFPQSLPPLQIPRIQVTQRLTKMTLRRIRRLLSGTETITKNDNIDADIYMDVTRTSACSIIFVKWLSIFNQSGAGLIKITMSKPVRYHDEVMESVIFWSITGLRCCMSACLHMLA